MGRNPARGRRRPPAQEGGNASGARPGRVVAHYGRSALVEGADGTLALCTWRRRAGPVYCGDRVRWRETAPGQGVIEAREPRRNVLSRADARGRLHPTAANVDRIAVVVAPRPPPGELTVDRYLVAAAQADAEPLVVVNKWDLVAGGEEAAWRERLAPYAAAGFPVLEVSARTGMGLGRLREALAGATSILVGQSGVGKSSLVKALLPDLEVRIGALSEASGAGRHTTTTTTLYHLPDGGDLIDSPGVREFGLGPLEPRAVQRGFPEIERAAAGCRFADCTHTVEPGCAVRAAAERGEVHPARYEAYRRLLAQVAGRD